MIRPPPWKEVYQGGSAGAEQALFRRMAREMLGVWRAQLDEADAGPSPRMMYAKTVAGATNALLVMDRVLPAELAVAHFHPGISLPASIRLSNASHVPQADGAPDMRGCAVRLALPDGRGHDLLFANTPTAIARNAEQFFLFFMASQGDQELLLARLATRLGEREGRRIAAWFKASFRLCSSLAYEYFWSDGALLWGDRPVRLKLRPLAPPPLPTARLSAGDDGLRAEFANRLVAGDIQFRLAVQQYVNEKQTPIEDAAVEWSERIAPPIEIATIIIPRRDVSGQNEVGTLRELGLLAFDPWNAPPQFRPLGSLNRLRRLAYHSSASLRQTAESL